MYFCSGGYNIIDIRNILQINIPWNTQVHVLRLFIYLLVYCTYMYLQCTLYRWKCWSWHQNLQMNIKFVYLKIYNVAQQLFFSLFIYKTKMFAGGVLAGSLAIISDAAHLLTDFASFMISLLALMLATRSPSKKFSFGWYRAGKRDTCKCLCP